MNELIVFYDRPIDFPDSAVARFWAWDGRQYVPTTNVEVGGSVEQLRDLLSLVLAGRVCVPRSPDDDPYIVETWV